MQILKRLCANSQSFEDKEVEQLEKEKDALMEDLLTQGQHGNISFYAFTATPKPKTLQTFGIPYPDSENPGKMKHKPYHIYSMQQAIEERLHQRCVAELHPR